MERPGKRSSRKRITVETTLDMLLVAKVAGLPGLLSSRKKRTTY